MNNEAIATLLRRYVPPFEDEPGDWADVLRRSHTRAPSWRVSRARLGLAVAAILVVIGALAATPSGRSFVAGALDRFGSWVTGEPGTPASAEQQAGFERRNQASYAAFPSGTKLRKLLETEVDGERFELLGFRTPAAFCLRLVRQSLPDARGESECVPTSYLEAVGDGVVVAGSANFRVRAKSVDGVYGFAADGVRGIEVEREQGQRSQSLLGDNVFFALQARPSGTAGDPPAPDAVRRIWALMEDGRRQLVPYVAAGYGRYGRKLPAGPAYFGPAPASELPGPERVEAAPKGAQIGWVERREERGEPFELRPRWLADMGTVLFARTMQPDPDDPFRLGLSVVRVENTTRFRGSKVGEMLLCLSELRPLGSHEVGGACRNLAETEGAFQVQGISPTEFTRVSGIAVDGVDSLAAFLVSGRRLDVSLRDNLFTFQAPFAEFPAKLVAYDADGRVVGIQALPGPHKLRPCPPAVFARSVSELPPPRSYELIDLGARTINGHQILGKDAGEVIAALGRPARIRHPSDTDHSSVIELRYGSGNADFAVLVQFGMRAERRVATSVVVQSPSTVDAELGHILRMQPQRLEKKILDTYGSRYEPKVAYGSIPGQPCTARLNARGIRWQLAFGLSPYRPSRPFVTFSWQ